MVHCSELFLKMWDSTLLFYIFEQVGYHGEVDDILTYRGPWTNDPLSFVLRLKTYITSAKKKSTCNSDRQRN